MLTLYFRFKLKRLFANQLCLTIIVHRRIYCKRLHPVTKECQDINWKFEVYFHNHICNHRTMRKGKLCNDNKGHKSRDMDTIKSKHILARTFQSFGIAMLCVLLAAK